MPPLAALRAEDVARTVAVALAVVFLLGDLALFLLWLASRSGERPLLARRWSVADLFLSLQFLIAGVLGVSIVGMTALFLFDPAARATPANASEAASPVAMFFLVLAPAMLAQNALLIGIPVLLVLLKYGGSLDDLGCWPWKGWARPVALGAAATLLVIPISDLLETLARRVLVDWPGGAQAELIRALTEQTNALILLRGIERNVPALVVVTLIVGVIGPIGEEVFFRGFAYRVFKERFGLAAGLVLSALLFAVIHGNPVGLLPIFVIGLALAWLYERTGNLAAPIGLHCANNLITLLMHQLQPNFSLWEGIVPK